MRKTHPEIAIGKVLTAFRIVVVRRLVVSLVSEARTFGFQSFCLKFGLKKKEDRLRIFFNLVPSCEETSF